MRGGRKMREHENEGVGERGATEGGGVVEGGFRCGGCVVEEGISSRVERREKKGVKVGR